MRRSQVSVLRGGCTWVQAAGQRAKVIGQCAEAGIRGTSPQVSVLRS